METDNFLKLALFEHVTPILLVILLLFVDMIFSFEVEQTKFDELKTIIVSGSGGTTVK